MNNQIIIEKILKDYQKIKINNPSFSLRAYSKKIGLNISLLSRILNNKIPITMRTVELLTERKIISEEEKKSFFSSYNNLFQDNKTEDSVLKQVIYLFLKGHSPYIIKETLLKKCLNIDEINKSILMIQKLRVKHDTKSVVIKLNTEEINKTNEKLIDLIAETLHCELVENRSNTEYVCEINFSIKQFPTEQ